MGDRNYRESQEEIVEEKGIPEEEVVKIVEEDVIEEEIQEMAAPIESEPDKLPNTVVDVYKAIVDADKKGNPNAPLTLVDQLRRWLEPTSR